MDLIRLSIGVRKGVGIKHWQGARLEKSLRYGSLLLRPTNASLILRMAIWVWRAPGQISASWRDWQAHVKIDSDCQAGGLGNSDVTVAQSRVDVPTGRPVEMRLYDYGVELHKRVDQRLRIARHGLALTHHHIPLAHPPGVGQFDLRELHSG